ncbi:hypothetical protein [Synechococcus sp. MIT S9507]|uniref:hypothetical protein n=1 Tax=Synechococcus sp. MIT S9507 TaxID=3082544 RepID=UPI0039B4E927
MTTVYALNDSKMLLVTEESGSKIRYDRSNQLAQQARKDKPLTSKQKKSVELLCAGLSPLCVADTVGISVDALKKWRKLPSFRVAVSEMMEVDTELHGVRLKALYGKALERVDALLDDKNPHIRLQAARLAFEAEQNIARVFEEQQMLQALEQRMEQLAEAAIHGPIPNEVHDAEIIEGEVDSD